MTLGEKINAANAEALKIILGAQPTLIGVGTAGEDIPGMTKKTILHSGPPVTWENMCDPTKVWPRLPKRLKSWPLPARSPSIPATITMP